MYELSLIKSLSKRDNYRKYRSYVKDKEFSKELLPVLKSLDDWYLGYDGDPAVEDLANLAFARGIPEKDREYLKSVFQSLSVVNGAETALQALQGFKTNRVLQDISLAAYEASEGRKKASEVVELLEVLRNPTEVEEIDYVTDDLTEILNRTVRAKGLRWRLNSLNRALGSLRKGNFGFVFARPETGKTTFLASEITHMASQLTEQSGPILWFNNEEDGAVVKQRLYQAALGCRVDHLEKAPERAMEAYLKVTNGKIKIRDSASIHRSEVEALCEAEKPSLVIFDQIDKIKGFKADREDLALGAIYQWAREIAKNYCPVIGVCQADASAENQKWLYMDNVANAKTAKQAEADFIIGIGKVHDAGLDFIRFINISKNKLSGDADTDRVNRHPQIEVQIDPVIARYKDL
jgi:KaiC/GvpD/RAD55 family RecA-like ATPase